VTLQGRTAVVTGAGRNVGRAIAAAFVGNGANVVVAEFDEERGRQAEQELNALRPASARFIRCDVASPEDVRRMVGSAVAVFDGIDILVNNVAITDRGRTVLDLEEAEWDRVFAVTLRSAFLCSKYVARQMVAQERGGSIVNIGSTSAHRARANALAYPVAKAGVLSLTRSLAVQLAPYRIRVNSVSPNKVGSPVGQDAEPADRGRSNLVGRSAVPGDIAAAVAFLVSDGAGFITAQELVVDGGALYAQPLD